MWFVLCIFYCQLCKNIRKRNKHIYVVSMRSLARIMYNDVWARHNLQTKAVIADISLCVCFVCLSHVWIFIQQPRTKKKWANKTSMKRKWRQSIYEKRAKRRAVWRRTLKNLKTLPFHLMVFEIKKKWKRKEKCWNNTKWTH